MGLWLGDAHLNSYFAISTSSTDPKIPHSFFCDFGRDKPLQLVGQADEFNLESKFEPLLIIWSSLQKPVDGSRRF